MEIVIAIASKIAEFTVAPVGRQLGYPIFYKSNVDKLKTEVQKLEEAMNGVQHAVDAAKRNGEDIEVGVQNWLTKVEDTVAEAKRFHNNEGHAKAGCSNWSFPNLWLRHQLSRKATKMAQGVSQTIAEGKFDKISYRASIQTSVTPSARGYQALDSRTSILNEIKHALKDPNFYMIGVCGMGGVGKSTLVKELKWQVEQDGSFGVVVMATITNSSDVRRIQGQLADGLGLKFDEETEQGRAGRLRQRINKETSILVILDDIWSKLDLTEVGVPFGDDHKGCKLLLTSRDLNVLNCEMGTQKDFRLKALSEKDSWDLFEKIAGDAVKDFNIKPIAVKVSRCCAGLPLLIVTVAKGLRKKDVYAWKDSLKQLERSDHHGLLKEVYPALELSYNCLENDELKSLFLFIASFGLHHLHTGETFLYSWGLGLHRHIHTLTEARNRYYKLINDLRASSLLLEGDSVWITMHDVVLDVAKLIASRAQPTYAVQRFSEIKQWPTIDELQKYHNIIVPGCHIRELPEKLECPKLKLLLLADESGCLKVPDDFFSQMIEVKVLEFGGLMFTPSLPPSLLLLTNLRTLSLNRCALEDISIVAELVSLEILSLELSEIKELSPKLGQLAHLKMLNLANCSGLRFIPKNLISSFTCLEELYMANCFIQWEVEGSKNQSNNASLGELRSLHQLTALDILIQDASVLPRNLQVFAKLERYNIFIGNIWKWSVVYSGGACETSRTLKLQQSKSTSIHLDNGLKLLLSTVEDLYLSDLQHVKNVLYELNGKGFPQLKHLHIQNSAELKYIINSPRGDHPYSAFPKLEILALHHLVNLEEICHFPIPTQCFTKLRVIEVEGCDKLKNLMTYSLVRDLPQLLEIKISKCKLMTEVIAEQTPEIVKETDKILFPNVHSLTLECLPLLVRICSMPLTADMDLALIDEKVAMPNLESMKLSTINMQKLWDDKLSAHSCIQNLTSLIIENCSSLKYVFSSLVARELVKLHYLEITNCQMLEEIFVLEGKLDPSTQKPLSSEEVIFPNLETLVISRMDNLKSVWHNQLATNSFCKLKKMETSFCNKLSILCPSYVLYKLHNLETMIITNCPALEVIFEIQDLNTEASSQEGLGMQLRTLTLGHLPILKHIWSRNTNGWLRFQKLCTLKATECESLNHVFPLSVAKELLHLQVLHMEKCGVEKIVAPDEMASTAPTLDFPELTSLTFWNLTQLRSFYPGVHTLNCPVLSDLDVYHCDQLEVFMSKCLNYHGHEYAPGYPQPLLSIEKVIPNIRELSLSSKDVTMLCNDQLNDDLINTVKSLRLRCFHELAEFPSVFLHRFTNLENLEVTCSSFTEILSCGSLGSEHSKTTMKLRSLILASLNNLKFICKDRSEIQPVLQNLENLRVNSCSRLKNIVPSSAVFQNLEELMVENCAGLENILTSSAATGLPKLRLLLIVECKTIEEIVASDNGSDAGEIAFMKLEILQLENLPRLTSFCKGSHSFKFPLLKLLLVMDCPMMETFSYGTLSAPKVRAVHGMPQEDEWRWDGDINSTIRKKFSETLMNIQNSNED